jgi:large subunit ribosomal protein L16
MLMPKKTKYRKTQRGTMKGQARKGITLAFGEYGLAVTEPGWITARQIESIRVTISRKLKKVGKFFLRIFPQKSVSKKPAETRMGKGKGSPEFWVFPAKRGRILCEISGLTRLEAQAVLRIAACKLPLKTRFIEKQQGQAGQQVEVNVPTGVAG